MAADSVELDLGSGGALVATDLIAAKQYQLVKLVLGAINANDGPVSAANPMPVSFAAPDLDTGYGLVTNTGTLTAVPVIGAAAVVYLDGMHFANPSAAAITVGVTDGSDRYIVPIQQVPAKGHLSLAFNGKPTTGLKWNASATGLYGQAWGRS